MQTQILKDEYWYGGAVHFGKYQPYDASSVATIDLVTGKGIADQFSPLFISNKGRFIHSPRPFVMEFNNGTINAHGKGEITLYDGYGTLKGAQLAAAKMFFDLSGQIPNRDFLQAPQYNTWIELMYNQNQSQILSYAQSLADDGMEPGILMIDEGWAPDYGDYDFCARKFSDPKAMIQKLHSMGYKVMLWVTPLISPDSACFRELRHTDYLLRDKDGEFAIRKWWNGYSCVLDLSNPDACKWFDSKLDHLIQKYGVDGFKFDAGGAHMYRADDKAFAIQEPCEHTRSFDDFSAHYSYNELRCVWDCGGKPIVCRLQDKHPSWTSENGITSLVPNMLAQGLLGYFFGCPDMVGGGDYGYFGGDKPQGYDELYLRWLEASVLCPMMQFSISPKRILSAPNYTIAKDIAKLHRDYSSLIVSLAQNASKTGEPIMRYMEYEFPNQGFEAVTDQFMLGSDVLVAPVTTHGATARKVKLPHGEWKYIDGSVYHGGEVEVNAPLGCLPIFERI